MTRFVRVSGAIAVAVALWEGMSAAPVWAQRIIETPQLVTSPGNPASRDAAARHGRPRTGGWKIDIGRNEQQAAVSPKVPLQLEISQPPASIGGEWLLGQSLLVVRFANATTAYFEETQKARLGLTTDKARAKNIPLLISKRAIIEEPGLKLRVENHSTDFHTLTITSRQTSAKFVATYNATGEPYIVACEPICSAADVERAATALADASGGKADPKFDPPKIDKVLVYAYNPETGEVADGFFAGVWPTCDTTKMRSAPPTVAGLIARSSRLFELPASDSTTYCLMISNRRDDRGQYFDYRCDTRVRTVSYGLAGVMQAEIKITNNRVVGVPDCPPPPPRVFSIQVLEQTRNSVVPIDLKRINPTIFRVGLKQDGTWEAPRELELGGEIRNDNITLENKDYEFTSGQILQGKIVIYVRRSAISFADLSFELTDELNTAESNCIASIVIPRRAVQSPKPLSGTGDFVDLPLLESEGRYFLTADLRQTSSKIKTPDVRLLLASLPEKLTVSMTSSACRLRPDGKYDINSAKEVLLQGPIRVWVARARPLLEFVLWPDRNIGGYATGVQRNRLWSDVILKAFQDAASDGGSARWRDVRLTMLTKGGVLKPLPAVGSSIDDVTNQITVATDPTAEDVVALFEDALFSRIAGNAPQAERVVVLAGQTAQRIDFCEKGAGHQFLKRYERTSVVLIDLVTQEAASKIGLQDIDGELMTCKPRAGADPSIMRRVSYVAILIPHAVQGNARVKDNADRLTAQLKAHFDQQEKGKP